MVCIKEKYQMKSYIEESLKYIESDEMRNYLCSLPYTLSPSTFADIVSFAPVSLERKIDTLDLIAEQTKSYNDRYYYNPAKLAKETRTALDERYDNIPGTFYRLRDWYYNEEGCYFGNAFFIDFDAATHFIDDQQKQYGEQDDSEYLSHSIDKYVPGENGKMEEYCEWILNYSGDIWYFDYAEHFRPESWDDLYSYSGDTLNLPVPFKTGDIVMADCRPFAKERRVLITDVGDNADCCSVQCAYLKPNGKIDVGAFKHNNFMINSRDENSHIPGLYRAKRWLGELAEDEAPLAVLSAVMKKDPDFGNTFWNYVCDNRSFDPNCDNDCRGAIWEQIKKEFRF
jgi:hypothetical protein